MPQAEEFIATGRRKTSVARVRMMQGSGKIDINGRTFEDYFPTVPLQNVVLQPLQNAKAVNTYDLFIHASGGGIMGQAGAAQLAIARALLQVCLLYTSDAADERSSVDLGGRRIIKKKNIVDFIY